MDRKYTAIIGMALLAACSDGTGPSGQPRVSLSFSAGGIGANPALSLSQVAADPISDGTNTIEITSAEVVLREIELKRVEIADCDVDACEKFEIGPVLIDVPVDGTVSQTLEVTVDPGQYDEVEFEIHKISNDAEDAAFAAAHPDLVGTSIRVTGFYNGDPFSFTTDLDVQQEFDIAPPMIVGETTTTANVTVYLDISVWFRDQSGNLVNPDSANKGGANEGIVKENIKQSIEAFEDHDSDGHPDL